MGLDIYLLRKVYIGAAAKENSKRFSPEKISVLWKTMFDSL